MPLGRRKIYLLQDRVAGKTTVCVTRELIKWRWLNCAFVPPNTNEFPDLLIYTCAHIDREFCSRATRIRVNYRNSIRIGRERGNHAKNSAGRYCRSLTIPTIKLHGYYGAMFGALFGELIYKGR